MNSKKSYLWNTIATLLNAAMSAVLLLVVIRTLGPEEGGVFSLGFSIAQLMLTIGYYDMRVYQATDVENKYSFAEYFNSRVVTCAAMVAISIIYVMVKGYTGEKLMIILLLCAFKMSDAIEDVYQGQMQKDGHLDTAGFLQTIRLIICMAVFGAVLIITHDLVLTCLISAVLALVLSVVLNAPMLKKYESFKFVINVKQVLLLLLACLPLCIGSYLSLYVGNAPKYAIDSYMGDAAQSYYNIVFMPSYVVSLLSGFIFKPALTSMAMDWNGAQYKVFFKKTAKLIVATAILTVIALVLAYICGCQVLGLFYGVDIMEYRSSLMVLMLGGGFYALGMILYYMVTITRQQKFLMIIYILVAIGAFFISPIFVKNMGLFGASVAYMISTVIRFVGFSVLFIVVYFKEKKNKEILDRGILN